MRTFFLSEVKSCAGLAERSLSCYRLSLSQSLSVCLSVCLTLFLYARTRVFRDDNSPKMALTDIYETLVPRVNRSTFQLFCCDKQVLFSFCLSAKIRKAYWSEKKLCHYTFVHNFNKCWPILKILSLMYSPRNLQQNPCHTAHHTLDVSLHYLVKCKRTKLAKFCCI